MDLTATDRTKIKSMTDLLFASFSQTEVDVFRLLTKTDAMLAVFESSLQVALAPLLSALPVEKQADYTKEILHGLRFRFGIQV